ncbi:hypothetical protein L3Y34_007210 [Caenorhabditis briggsae]|uniref:Transcription factor AP-2 C-terminal domain-containing protein n=1 Tax=Caenorhabditis briggsae TaxID=6238 RepID=A0AAE9CZF2_CAEBR|nr:hypothetical protein L3Y34_007210 [Caenorhabditis briggsae]
MIPASLLQALFPNLVNPQNLPETEEKKPEKLPKKDVVAQIGSQNEQIPNGFETEIPSKEDVFEEVSGRLSHHTKSITYQVTTEEVRRRLFGPENLNSSSMAQNLRRAKSRAGGEILRKQLEQKGVTLKLNQRQTEVFPNQMFALVEGEAIHMAKDMEELVDEQYNSNQIAQEVVDELEDDKLDFEGFETCMSSLSSAFSSVVPPLTGLVPKSSQNRKFNREMEIFSNVTHGFGIVSQPTWIRQMLKIGEKMEEIVKKEKKENGKKEKE